MGSKWCSSTQYYFNRSVRYLNIRYHTSNEGDVWDLFFCLREHKPLSHAKVGWEQFTNRLIQVLSEKLDYCVFLLWGGQAHTKEKLIDSAKHTIIKTAHPSPLALGLFINSNCFADANKHLNEHGKGEVNWCLTE